MSGEAQATGAAPSGKRSRGVLGWTLWGIVVLLIGVLVVALGTWAWHAIYYSNLPGQTLRTLAAWTFVGGFALAFLLVPRRRRTLMVFLASWALVHAWWWFIPASHERDWITENAVLPHATIDGDRVTLHDVRDFHYRTPEDFDVDYYDRTYDLNELTSLDYVISHWDGLEDVAHTLFSFGFNHEDYVTVSVETRREKTDGQGAIPGIFKQYELIYILGDERDLVQLRTSYRQEEVWVYPTRFTPEEARIVLLDILETVNGIHQKPKWYNTITHNCTTSLVPHLEKVRGKRPFDIRLLLNGHSAQMAYENGRLRTELSFEEARRHYHANQYVEVGADLPDFSRRIRPDLTGGGDGP